ncbi:MAG TPA: protein-disulfide reductase DsbD [Burkholderiales bacterium]
MLLASTMLGAAPMSRAADLLAPEQAFRISAQLVEPALIEVRYRIAEGYYLYREKFSFGLQPVSVRLERPRLPRGVAHEDEFFGKVETYRGEMVIRLPLAAPLRAGATLKAVSQGCADAGICYPPQTHNVEILPVVQSGAESFNATTRKPSGLLASLSEQASARQENEEFLPVDQAFKVQARMPDAQTVVVRFVPAESYYLYRDKTTFAVDAASKVAIESVQLPRGEMKKDPNFGDTEVFHQAFHAVVRLKKPADGPFSLTAAYQGCSEKGLCYPPEKKAFPLAFAAGTSGISTAASEAAAVLPAARTDMADDSRIASLLGSGNFLLIIASFLGFGLLLSLTPCMWPMIPILSGIIAGQGEGMTRSRGLVLSAAYVLGMALAYAIAGVVAGVTGTLLSSALQNPWILGAFALVFVLLAFSMFGFYELQLPAALQSRLSATSNRLKGGTLNGVFLMGVLSAVIVGPCVAAPLAGALLYISQSRDMILGGSALFAMALGMGLPLLVIGASAGALLPKAGAWMQSVKNLFGVFLLAAAIWIISPVIPAAAHMLLWAGLLIVAAIFLHAIDALPPDASGFRKLWKGVGVIALLLGIALLAGVLSGGRDILRPLSGLRVGNAAVSVHTPFVRVGSLAELDAAVAGAGRPVMLDFYADWCVSCKEMERFTFSDDAVRKRLDGMLLLQADVTANTSNDKALLARFGLFGPPGIIFFDREGKELKDTRVIGFQSAGRFAEVLDAVAAR